MELDVEELKIKNTTKCECGHEFTIQDMTELKRINKEGFYGNIVKHYSKTNCPECEKETILLLKQVGQTYKVLNIATIDKQENEESVLIFTETEQESTRNKQEQENNVEITNTQEFICPECKKACKSKIGLTAHMKTHQN